MHGPAPAPRAPQMGRWILIAVLLVLGIALFFIYGPSTEPAARPAAVEGM